MIWWKRLLGRRRIDAQLDAELRDHIERQVADYMRAGMSEAEARREAHLAFGGVERMKEECRDVRPTRWVEHIAQDIRYALRQLRRQPGFTTVALLTLVVGIASNTTIFAVVNGVLLRPLPYPDPDRLVHAHLGGYQPQGQFLAFRERGKTMRIGAYRDGQELTLTGSHEAVRLMGARASAELFSVLGTLPVLGRTFRDEEMRPGADAVIVLSHRLWQQRFGGDESILGRSLVLDGVPRSVVGVMPPEFRFPSRDTGFWIPLTIDRADRIDLWAINAWTIGRLHPGVSLEQARTEVRSFTPTLRELFPSESFYRGWEQRADVMPLRQQLVGDIERTLVVLWAAVGSVMLIVCVNLANLLLARGMARHRELAIRGALGAGRGRLFRQLLVESLTLSLLAGVLATALAFASLQTVVSLLPPDIPRIEEIQMDVRVLSYALGLSVLTGLLFGLLPALHATVSSLGAALSRAGRSMMTGRPERRASDLLAGAEYALALVLVVAAVLLMKSLWNLTNVDPGFHAEQLVSATVVPPELKYPDVQAKRRFVEQVVSRLRQLPNVHAVAFATAIPFGGERLGGVFAIEGQPDPETAGGAWCQTHSFAPISPDYLRVLRVPLLAGRAFTEQDREGAKPVALISRSLAKTYWPGENPVGQRIRTPGPGSPWITIVGIVDDVKWSSLADEGSAILYFPAAQYGWAPTKIVARMTGDPVLLARNLRGMVASLDKNTPVSDIRTANELLAESVAQPRFTASVLMVFAGIALFLGAIGIYGVMAYAVSRRTQEMGVRVALGASRRDLLRQFLGRGLGIALAGITVGLCGAVAITRALSSLLFDVEPLDVGVFAGVAIFLGAVGLLASYLPARRAAHLNPVDALRTD
ncbi:MAG: FtsX-like permease family protein [Luteitalea sp.]|nr:FtsX-like permease family protein [Luteitalea sp.]